MIFFTVLSVLVLIIVSSVTFLYPRSSPFFIHLQINTQIENCFSTHVRLGVLILSVEGSCVPCMGHRVGCRYNKVYVLWNYA